MAWDDDTPKADILELKEQSVISNMTYTLPLVMWNLNKKS